MTVKPGIVEHGLGLIGIVGMQQGFDGTISLAVKRGKKIDKQRQHYTAKQKLPGKATDFPEKPLKAVHHPGKIERNQPAKDAEHCAGRHPFHTKRRGKVEIEHGARSRYKIAYASCGCTADEQRHKRGHGKVDHQDLNGENQSCNGSLEDAGNGSRSAAADENHQRAMVHAGDAAEETANGRACEHNW